MVSHPFSPRLASLDKATGALPAKGTAMINDSPAYARFLKVLVLAAIWTMAAATGRAATLTENFATNPLGRGWQIFGDTNLFLWNAAYLPAAPERIGCEVL